jgi:uncharacterized membrane protein
VVYLNVFQLFWIVLLPISTSLWIRIETIDTTMVMGANLTLIALGGLLLPWNASNSTGLAAPFADDVQSA